MYDFEKMREIARKRDKAIDQAEKAAEAIKWLAANDRGIGESTFGIIVDTIVGPSDGADAIAHYVKKAILTDISQLVFEAKLLAEADLAAVEGFDK